MSTSSTPALAAPAPDDIDAAIERLSTALDQLVPLLPRNLPSPEAAAMRLGIRPPPLKDNRAWRISFDAAEVEVLVEQLRMRRHSKLRMKRRGGALPG